MGKRFLHNRAAVVTVAFVLLIALIGILAPLLAPHDPYVTDILNKFAPYSLEYPLGTDHLQVRPLPPDLRHPANAGTCPSDHAGDHRTGRAAGRYGRLLPGRGGRGHHAGGGRDAFLPQPDHGVRRGGPSGDQCPKCHHCQCVHQMGVVCPHDPNRCHAVPGPELCSVLPVRGNAGAVHPVPTPSAVYYL